MGPLTLADFIGLDVCVDILRVLQEGFGDPKYSPCPLLVRMVDAGGWGGSRGGGFTVTKSRVGPWGVVFLGLCLGEDDVRKRNFLYGPHRSVTSLVRGAGWDWTSLLSCSNCREASSGF
jgi:3-hydroxyacyl-CoA dehydrogenase